MLNESYFHDPTLINTVGHTAGLLLFGVILFLLVRDGRAHGLQQIRMSLIAAALAFAWNAGSLFALASPNPQPTVIRMIMTASFSFLSLLPAVLLHVAVRRQRWVVLAGYAVSSCALVLHFAELFQPEVGLHQSALLVIAVGFDLLTLIAFGLRRFRESQPLNLADWISLAGLLLFSSSFLHFGYQHVNSPWAAEIAWHHIGIPVALIVLLQDYRFLLLDMFVRFLVNSASAAIYLATFLALNHRFPLLEVTRQSKFLSGLALVALSLSLILFSYCRNILQGWVGRVIFHRQDVEVCLKAIANVGSVARTEEELLTGAALQVAKHLRTSRCAVLSETKSSQTAPRPAVLFKEQAREVEGVEFSPEVQIPLRFSSGNTRVLTAGARFGGQRYLSEDLEDVRRLGSAIEEQVERFRAEELKRLVNQAELRALQAQINPHFLFNALNTLYGIIDRTSFDARRMVLNLAEIFRYFLQGDREVIPLFEELKIVQAYLEIECLRLGDRLKTEISVSESARSVMIPILSIQPLVENAVKHGVSSKPGPGSVSLSAEKTDDGVRVTVRDTGVGFEGSQKRTHNGTGVGLENVRRRLKLCYGPEAGLEIQSSSEGSSVTFFVPDRDAGAIPTNGLRQPTAV